MDGPPCGGEEEPHQQSALPHDLEKIFAEFLDGAKDVIRYLKNERFGFFVTYYEHNHPRQFNNAIGHGAVLLNVRLPEKVIKKVDEDLDQLDVPLSRNNWPLDSAIEKLRKGGSGGSQGTK